MNSDNAPIAHPKRRLIVRTLRRLVSRSGKVMLALIGLYILAVLVGLIPVNNDFEAPSEGIKIFVVSNSVHADIVIPIATAEYDWSDEFEPTCFRSGRVDTTHLAIGWGDKGFFIETPKWSDLKVSTASRALFWPSATCLHVQGCNPADLPVSSRSVTITPQQYLRLVEYIRRSFLRDDFGNAIQIAGAHYGLDDAFFEAKGVYHCFNTCNCWIGGSLKEAGVRTGWFTPLPKTVYWYLPR